jgi:hypothetical protein
MCFETGRKLDSKHVLDCKIYEIANIRLYKAVIYVQFMYSFASLESPNIHSSKPIT